jgi:hypothetical protein
MVTPEGQRHLAEGKPILTVEPSGSGPRLFLSRALAPTRPELGVVHAEINAPHLWDLDDDAPLAPQMRLVVLDGTGQILFSTAMPTRRCRRS